jgi:hypothetical protein
MKTPPKAQSEAMSGGEFFTYAAELLKVHRPHLTDQPILARMKKIRIEPGKGFEIDKVSPAVRAAIEAAPASAQSLMQWKMPTLARVANHWSMNTDTVGVYGNYYLKRAIIANVGLGANVPHRAVAGTGSMLAALCHPACDGDNMLYPPRRGSHRGMA